MIRHTRYLLRLTVLAWRLRRAGLFDALLSKDPAAVPHTEGLAQALESLGPGFIKLGQVLSTRPDMVGPTIAGALARLRDALPPFPAAVARTRLEEALGAPIETMFRAFDDMPVAAASIAQVHRAETLDGTEVAVKITRPGVAKAFARDVDFFYWAARLLERRSKRMRRLKPVEVVRTLERSMRLELDLRFEAAAAEELHENSREDARIAIACVDWTRSAATVLTSGWLDGIPIHERTRLIQAGHDPEKLVATLAEMFFTHVFRDGFFHADLHPGNVFVLADGRIGLVDFGIMGRLDAASRRYLANIFYGFLSGDFLRVARAHLEAGYVPPHHSVMEFAQACRAIAKPILDKPMGEISIGALLGQLFLITEMFEMETRPELLLLQKSLVVVEGVGRMLAPHTNMWELARAPIEHYVREHFSPRAAIIGKLKHLAALARECLRD